MVTLTDGDNTFDQDDSGEQKPDTINALGGDDLILTSTLGGSLVQGGEGNDTLQSRGPSGVGNSGLADTLAGGAGDDSLDFQAASGLGFGDAVNNASGSGNDTLVAASRASLYGGNGDDFLRGLIGNNLLFGNRDNDILIMSQRDSLYGGKGADTISFSVGNGVPANLDPANLATLSSATGNENFISANSSTDFVAAWGSKDTIFGGKDNDTIYSFGSQVRASGDVGDDIIINRNRETIGIPGNSTATALTEISRSTLLGGEGDDSIIGAVGPFQDGRNSLDGGVGNDTIRGQAARDTLIGGEGNDYIETGLLPENQSPDKVTSSGVPLNTTGFSGLNRLDGGAGNDTLVAGFLTDTMIGGLGNDCLSGIFNNADGGDGDDTIDATTTGTSVTQITLLGGAGDDRLLGNTNTGVTNYFNGGTGNDFIQFGTTNDELIGNTQGDDTIISPQDPGTGISIIDTEGNNSLIGGVGGDTLVAGAGDDFIEGGLVGEATGNDSLVGGAGNDTIFGRSGTDTILGGAGDDYIVGGINSTADSLIGGEGNDSFVFFSITDARNSVIVDFNPADDQIILLDDGFGLASSSADSAIAANDFVSVPSGDNYENGFARVANPVIIYERNPVQIPDPDSPTLAGSGLLKYDPSGNGGPDDLSDVVTIARLNGTPNLTQSDILII
ncbi:calcium-binding protein [Okeania sp.]|uniref:calcium-binding protein n=1 Tax=Okeania sp. TaxID=3100323 RepID=UPI002B4B57E9|nr:calcium-binding protein [Okeania sp.]MEB3341987.1 calcium-binding protein [Okeania sp.]